MKLTVRHPVPINVPPQDGMMANQTEPAAGNEHLRAICEEVGYRLGLHLDKTSPGPSARLQALLLRFEEAEQIESPSIVPAAEDMKCPEPVASGAARHASAL
jgi:hypothetical protein